jgi:hypothetical protein
MSILKTTLAAATLALVAATAANAQTYVPAQKRANIEARQAQAFVRGAYQAPTNQWDVNSPQPFSRDANDHFTW